MESTNYLKINKTWRNLTYIPKITPYILAGLVTGFSWYFANHLIDSFHQQQNQLIRRVESGQIGNNFKQQFDPENVQQWNCKKVNLDGYLKDGRFFIKRNRGKQEGYLVLAPFTVNNELLDPKVADAEKAQLNSFQRKFVLNLGWVPKSKKHLLLNTVSDDIIGQETYEDRSEALQKQEQDGLIRDPLKPDLLSPIYNVQAYIRTGEQANRSGYTNWKSQRLYKYIDLNLLTRAFRIFNERQAETIYLQRTAKNEQQNEVVPLPASKQTVIEDLKNKTNIYESQTKRKAAFVGLLSFGAALLV